MSAGSACDFCICINGNAKKHTTASKLINLNIAEDSPVVLILKVIPNVEM